MKTLFSRLSCLFLCASALHAAATTPKPLETPSPGYPAALAESGLSGSASIECLVKADGSVAEARIKSADHEAFGAAALATITQWRFEPATVDGAPVDKRVTVPFKFAVPVTQQLNAKLKRKVFQDLTEPVLTQKQYGRKLKAKKPLRTVTHPGAKSEVTVPVRFIVAPDGSTLNPEIVGKVQKEFMLPAIATIAQAQYESPQKDGQPVYVEMTTKLTFAPPQRARRGGGGGGGGGGGDFGGGGGGFGDGGGGGGFGGGSPDE